jgi:PAS domain S-box-containing protein
MTKILTGERRTSSYSNVFPILRNRRNQLFGEVVIREIPKIWPYIGIVLLTWISVFLREEYDGILGLKQAPYLISFALVALATLWGGEQTGWFATILTGLTALNELRSPELIKLGIYWGEAGAMVGIIGRLISSQNELKEKLKLVAQSDKHLRNVINSLSVYVAILSRDGVLIEANSAVLESMGEEISDFLGQRFEEANWWRYSEEMSQKLKHAIDRASQGEIVREDLIINTKNNKFLTIDFTLVPIKDDQGQVKYLIPSGVDVSERVKTLKENEKLNQALNKEKERMERILTGVPAMVWYLNKNSPNHPNYINRQAEILTGYEIEEIKRKGLLAMVVKEDREKVQRAIEMAYQKGLGTSCQYRIKSKGGRNMWVESRILGETDLGGEVVRVVGMTYDITDRKLLEQRKDEFMSIASHELKTPLTTIKAFTQILKRQNQKLTAEQQKQYLVKMDSHLERLTKLINDLLDISKIQMGKLKYNKQPVLIDEVVDEVLEDFQTSISSHRIIKKGKTKKKVWADKQRISQVLVNLISNAVKYSPGEDKVIVKLRDREDEIVVGVRDFGIGVPPESHSKVFEKFYRAETLEGLNIEGFGLGLYLCDEIIRRHNGKIWVEDEARGSTFKFTLPTAPPLND